MKDIKYDVLVKRKEYRFRYKTVAKGLSHLGMIDKVNELIYVEKVQPDHIVIRKSGARFDNLEDCIWIPK